MPPSFTTVTAHGLAETAALLNEAFADYLVPLQFSADSLQAMTRSDQVDLAASQVLLDDGEPVGVALIARRGNLGRLAGMALVPAARARGLGRRLLQQTLADARVRGDAHLELEVIDQNEPAKQLYLRAGFRPVQALLSFDAPAAAVESLATATEIRIPDFVAAAEAHASPDTPWQISAPTLDTVDPARHCSLQVGALLVLIAKVRDDLHVLRGLVCTETQPDPAQAAAALRAARARRPESAWRVPALFPATFAPWFEAAGFTPGKFSQTQLRHDLRPAE